MKPRTLIFIISTVLFSFPVFSEGVGRFTIETTPPKAQLFIDGKPMGNTPKTRLKMTPGSHQIEIKRKDGTEVSFAINIQDGKTFKCSHSFDTGQTECSEDKSVPGTKAAKKGKLHLISDPVSQVYVDGKGIGATPVDTYEVSEGHHVVEFRLPNYESVTKDVDVPVDQTTTVEAAFSTPKTSE